jgi:hypothetical protein
MTERPDAIERDHEIHELHDKKQTRGSESNNKSKKRCLQRGEQQQPRITNANTHLKKRGEHQAVFINTLHSRVCREQKNLFTKSIEAAKKLLLDGNRETRTRTTRILSIPHGKQLLLPSN